VGFFTAFRMTSRGDSSNMSEGFFTAFRITCRGVFVDSNESFFLLSFWTSFLARKNPYCECEGLGCETVIGF